MKNTVYSKYRLLFLCFFLLIWNIQAGVMGNYDKDSGIWSVDTGIYQCKFFPGCMYPVWFKDKQDRKFPFFIFSDRIRDQKELYHLSEERWAELKILKNTDSEFIAELRGNFCHNAGKPAVNVPFAGIGAVYKYTLKKNDPLLKIKITLTKKEKKTYDLNLIRLRWRFMPFHTFRTARKDIVLNEFFKQKNILNSDSGFLIGSGVMMKITTPEVRVFRMDFQNGFLFMQDAALHCKWPADQSVFRGESGLIFQSVSWGK